MAAELRANLLLRAMEPGTFKRVTRRLTVLDVGAGDIMHLPGVPDGWIYFPLTALLALVVSDASGTGVAVGVVGPEGATGLTAALTGVETPAEVVCTIPGRVARLSADALPALVADDVRLLDAVVGCLSAQLVEVVQLSACNRLHPLADRLARWLLCAQDRSGRDELPLTHDLLARLLGASRPNVSAVMEAFARRGLVATERGAIRILDREGLARAGRQCFQPVPPAFGRLGAVSGRTAPSPTADPPGQGPAPSAARARGTRRRTPPPAAPRVAGT